MCILKSQYSVTEKTMHLAIFSYAHFYIKVLQICKTHAPTGCTGVNIYASRSQNVHVHPKFRTLRMLYDGFGGYSKSRGPSVIKPASLIISFH